MMHDGDIDYSSYTLRELEEALSGINKQVYPKNYENLQRAYALLRPKNTGPSASEISPPVRPDEPYYQAPRYDKSGRYIPNHIPANERIKYVVFSALLGAYGTYGVWVNDLYVPGKRSRGIHLQDAPAWMMYGAFICACLVMLSIVADHYDTRNNEKRYRMFADVAKGVGWTLFVLSLAVALFR